MVRLLVALIRVYGLVLVARIVFSWLPPRHRRNEFYRFLYSITEPALKPFRRILPPMGGIDFSPILLFLLLQVLAHLVAGL